MTSQGMASKPVRYVIFFVPRSGSTLLCNLLENAGYGGAYGHADYLVRRYERLRLSTQYRPVLESLDWEKKDLKMFFKEVFKSTENRRGVQGFKVFSKDLAGLTEIIAQHSRYRNIDSHTIVRYFPRSVKYVYLRRKNRVRQAISHARALKGKRWCHHSQKHSRTKPSLDLKDVLDAYADVRLVERETVRLLRRNRIRPLRLTFEELRKDKKATVLKVVRHLGFNPRDVTVKEDLKRQSDSYSDRLYRRYAVIIPLRWRWMRLWEVLFAWSARLKERSPAYASAVRLVKRVFGVRPR